jgi:hypothetical protein
VTAKNMTLSTKIIGAFLFYKAAYIFGKNLFKIAKNNDRKIDPRFFKLATFSSGIGIDDTFVMLGAWRRTSVHTPVPERMSASFEDAAVSITITSVTNMISFWIGVITPFPSVQIFCIYTGEWSPMVSQDYLHISLYLSAPKITIYVSWGNKMNLSFFAGV